MKVRIRLFALLRERAEAESLALDLPDGATTAEAWAILVGRHPALADQTPAAAVNARLAGPATPLAEGDELAFLPPVSGG